MEFNLEKAVEQIKSHPLFIKLKNVIENIEGWHDQENVYDHLIKTSNHAIKFSDGNFITNRESKEKFSSWIQEDSYGIKKRDQVILTALLHDCGKILYFEEGGNKQSMNVSLGNGQTSCPGHEYWGGKLIVPELLKDVSISNEAKRLIGDIVSVHGDLSEDYFSTKKDWTIEKVILDVKSRANGYYQETLFNQYVDCYDAPAFKDGIKRIEELFNYLSFYTPREYILP